MTTTNHSFISSDLTFIIAFGYFSSMPLSKRRLIPFHPHHKVGSTCTYKSKGYSIRRVSSIIQDDKGEQKSDDKDLER